MGIEGLVNGDDGEPEPRHEYIDEEKSSKGAQGHEGQHGSRARVRCPAQMWGEKETQGFTRRSIFLGCVLTNSLIATCRDGSCFPHL